MRIPLLEGHTPYLSTLVPVGVLRAWRSLVSRIAYLLTGPSDVFSITPRMILSTFRLLLFFFPWSVVVYPLSICEMTFLTSLDRSGRAPVLRYYPADSGHLVRFFVVQQE